MSEKQSSDGLIDRVRKRVAGVKDRASWALDGGKLATEGVQEKTLQAQAKILQATLDDPAAVKALGLRLPNAVPPAAADESAAGLDTKDLATVTCEMLSHGAVLVAKRAGFHAKVVPIAGLDAEERKLLAPSIAKVIDKWLPKDLGKWAEEIELLTKLVALAIHKFALLRAAQRQYQPADGERIAA